MPICTYYALASGLRLAVELTDNYFYNKDSKKRDKHFSLTSEDEGVYGHSLAMPPGWGDLAAHYDPVEIAKYWRENPMLFHSEKTEYLTLGEYITLRLLDAKEFLPISSKTIVEYCGNKFRLQNSLFRPEKKDLEIRWAHVILKSTQLALNSTEESGIHQYNKIVNALCTLDQNTRRFLVNALEVHFQGSIENLAMHVDNKNIRFVLGKFKLANSIPLFWQLLDSPTWKGKFTAIIRLLELFNVDVFQASQEIIQSMASFILKAVSWIMEKTEEGAEFVKNKCGWKSVKDEPLMVQYQSGEVKCACGKQVTRGCSMCTKHLCESCVKCPCPNEFLHEINECECGNNRDCLFRAIGRNEQMPELSVKRHMYDGQRAPLIKPTYEKMREEYGIKDVTLDFEEFGEVLLEGLKINNDADMDLLWLAGILFNKNVQVSCQTGEVRSMQIDPAAQYMFLTYTGEGPNDMHFEMDSDKTIKPPTHYIWGTPFEGWKIEGRVLSRKEVRQILSQPSSISSGISTPSGLCTPKDVILPSLLERSPLTVSEASTQPPSPLAEAEGLIQPTPIQTVTLDAQQLTAMLRELGPEDSSSDSETSSLNEYVQKKSELVSDIGNQEQSDVAREEQVVEEPKEKKESPSFFEALKSWDFGSITNGIKEWFKTMSKEVIEYFENSPFVAGMMSVVFGVAQFFGFYTFMPTTKTGIAGIMEKFSNSTRTMHYARQGFKGILDSVKDCFACIKDMLGIENNPELEKFKREVSQALVTCRDMLVVAQSKPGEFVNDTAKYLKFRKQFLGLSDTYSKLAKFSDARELAVLTPIWFSLSKTMDSLTHIYTKFVNGMNSRIVPVCTYLWGATNLGKSSVLSHLTNMLNEQMGRTMSSYTISKGNPYWNNFGGQEVIRIDDMNSYQSPSEGDLDSLNLFNLITDAPFIPTQAAIPDKGVMAAPHFVICASNLPSLPTNTNIADVKAWERRRHFFVHVSYPEHEKKCGETTNCEHFKGKSLDNFDHLTFTICDPVISNSREKKVKKRGVECVSKVIDTPGVEEILETGERVTLQELVRRMADLHMRHKQAHEVAFDAAVKAGTMKQQTAHWSKNPCVAIDGVPGTGKSTIFQRMEERFKKLVHRMTTIDEFKMFMKSKCDVPDKKFVIIDDLSLLKDDPECWKGVSRLINSMYNSVKLNKYTLIFGVNRGVLEQQYGEETVDQLLRRCHVINSYFQAKPLLQRMGSYLGLSSAKQYYSYTDIAEEKKKLKEGEKIIIDNFVSYYEGDTKLTQEGVISLLRTYEPNIQEVKMQNALAKKTKIQATCMCKIGLSSTELISFINKSSVKDTVTVVSQATLKSFGKSKMTKLKFAQALADISRKCKGMTGARYESFSDLMLQAANLGFLGSFKNECCALVLNDIIYYVDNIDGSEVGILDCGVDDLMETISDLKVVTDMSALDRLSSLATTMFPPWFTLALDTISTVVTVATPVVSSMLAVQDQSDMYHAYNMWNPTHELVESGANTVFTKTFDNLANKLGVNKGAQQLVPGLAHAKLPQHGFADHVADQIIGDVETGPQQSSKLAQRTSWHHETGPKESTKHAQKNNWKVESVVTRHYPTDTETSHEYLDRAFKDVSMTAPTPEVRAKDTHETVQFQACAPEAEAEKVVQQIATDPALYPIINSVLGNVCEILSRDGTKLCNGVFVRGRTVRTVHHLYFKQNLDNLFVRTMDGKVYATTPVFQEEIYDRLDLKITDPAFQAKKDISSHFPSRTSLIAEGTYAVLVTPNFSISPSGPIFTLRSYMVKGSYFKLFQNLSKGYYVIDYRGHKAGYMMPNGPVQTTNGDCGSMLILADPNFNGGKVIGIHTAASDTIAYASPLYKDQYEDKVQFQAIENKSKIPLNVFPLKSNDPEGLARTDIPIYTPSKTRLYENLYPLGEKVYEPAVLDSRDTRSTSNNVLYEQSIKWRKERKVLSTETKQELTECMDDIAQHFAAVLKSEGCKLTTLTTTEALNKYRHSSHSEPINVHTSPGFPWNVKNSTEGKTKYINVDQNGIRHINKFEYPRDTQQLLDQVNVLMNPEELERRGKMSIFQVFLKDECVKLKKIYQETKTRTIAAAPLDFQIAYRRMMHTAHCAMMDCWHLLPLKIGINPLSLDWHTLFMSMAKVNMQAVDLDYKGWDFSTHPFIIGLLPKFYDALFKNLDPDYTERDNKIREGLYSQIMNFHFLVGRTLYQSTGGIPSGYPGTAPDNSLINLLITYWAFRRVAKQTNPKHNNWYSFNEFVSPAIYGDDIVMSVNQDVLQQFNGLTIPGIVAELGFDAQPADKGDTFVAARPLKDCIFLSRGFKFVSGFWIGPLLKEHLFKPSWYCRNRKAHFFWQSPTEKCTDGETISSTYESMLYEAALHDDGTFELVYDAAMKVYQQYGLNYPIKKADAIARIFGDNIQYKEIEGLTFSKCDDLLEKFNIPGLPPHHNKFHNRTSYSYGEDYHYNGNHAKSNPMPKNVKALVRDINNRYGKEFNSVLVNIYPAGGEIPWHKDDERDLDIDHGILGVTLFGDGEIQFKDHQKEVSFFLEPGYAYMMETPTLTNYKHRRVNHKYTTCSFTFRRIVPRQ